MTAGQTLRRVARTLWRLPERLLHPVRRKVVLRRLRRLPRPQSVLVLCYGNLYRSPYAAALLRRALTPLPDEIRVDSAGFIGPGRRCPPAAVELGAAQGVDLSGHRSRLVTQHDVRVADLIVVMDGVQRRALRVQFGRAGRSVVTLGDLDPEPIDTRGIEDPWDMSLPSFQRSYSRIDRCVRTLGAAVAGDQQELRP
jgi:low molecular weight protein-tyrosine phosphatase